MTKTQDVKTAVETELIFDPLIDAANITVANLAGDVSLRGDVSSYPEYAEAAAAARRVSGVTMVHNHLEVALPEGSYRSDAALTTAANNALAWDVMVPDGVEATVRNGNVKLTGDVRFGAQRDAAIDAVSGLTGVRNVKDHIEIVYDADPVDVAVRVQDALDRWSLILDDSSVYVSTDDDVVTLAGHVASWAEHDAVVSAAWMAPGVTDVRDDMLITY
jgi:osmotically-inducible protein OsmY